MSEAHHLRVLIVEDDFLVRQWVQQLLELSGYSIAGVALDGPQAVAQTQALQPDIVLMDIGLPGEVDGLEAARRISLTCPTPVVVLTAYESPEMLERAGAAGVGAYLTKPTDERALERALTIAQARFQDLVALRRLNDELQAEIARRRQAEEARTRLSQELMTLYETSLEINAQPDLPQLLHFIADRTAQVIHARLCALYLTQPDGRQALQLMLGAGDSHPALPPDSVVSRLADQTALGGRALLPDGFQHEGHYLGRVMSLPLQAGLKVVGVIVLADDRQPEPFNEHDFWLAGLFAEQAAIALENAQLREAARSELAARQQAELTLRESQERYQLLVDLSPDPIAVHSEGRFVYVNPALVELAGLKQAEDLLGKPALNIVEAGDRTAVADRIRQAYQTNAPIPLSEERFVRPDGTIVTLEVTARAIIYQGKPAILTVGRDISARKPPEQL
jgi:PAS domain S-box-containing protein